MTVYKNTILISILVSILFIIASKNQCTSQRILEYKLPETIKPSYYKLDFTPDFNKKSFHGHEIININISKSTNFILLNCREIKINRAKILQKNSSNNLTVSYDEKSQRCKFVSIDQIKSGKYKLEIDFEGILNNQLRGFYLSKYTDSEHNERLIATTKMEPADARRMFPCFDEPAFKSQFEITAHIDSKLVAISNNYLKKKFIDKDNKMAYQFAPTPKMSTYLVALIIGPFESTQNIHVQGCDINVWSVKGKVKLANYAQSCAQKLLEYYNSYFQIKYPLRKLDLIAIPDFESGAMENLGAITFRESLLLVDDKNGSVDNKQLIASVTAHEMAHMWFGDLVTMAWWDDLWLNEAFATWMSIKAIDNIEPSWQFYYHYITTRLNAMDSDSLVCSRPIHANVTSPEQAQEMFDNITYSKGCSILKMIESYIGENDFRRGIRYYLSKNLYSNATTQDLWDSLSKISRKPVNEFAPTFVNQAGYPLLTLKLSKDNRLVVNQKQFLKFISENNINHKLWLIPLSVMSMESETLNLKNYKDTMNQIINNSIQEIQNYRAFEPFKANLSGYGYYRIVYPESNLSLLLKNNIKLLQPVERLTLLNDEWNISQNNIVAFMDRLKYFQNEKNSYVIKELINCLNHIVRYVDENNLTYFAKYSNNLLKNIYADYGIEDKLNDTMLVKSTRASILIFLGTYGQNKDIISTARNYLNKNLFEQYNNNIDGDKLKAYLKIVAFNGNKNDYDAIYNNYLNAKSPEIEKDCLFALTGFRDKNLINNTLNLCLTDKIRTQDIPQVIGALFLNSNGLNIALDFFESKYDSLSKILPPTSIRRIIQALGNLNTSEQLISINKFFDNHEVIVGKQTLKESKATIEDNVKFGSLNRKKICDWLIKHSK